MKSLLLSFEDFIMGSGIWILVGCLAFCLLISIVFLILNIKKEKENLEKGRNTVVAPQVQAKPEVKEEPKEEIKDEPVKAEAEVKAEVKETKKVPAKAPAKKAPVKKEVKEETKQEESKKSPAKTAEKKAETKKVSAKKAPVKQETKTVKKVSKPAEPVEEESGNYDISYDFNSSEWVVKRENSLRATKRTKTKQEAIDFAKPLAEKNEVKLIIHNKNEK